MKAGTHALLWIAARTRTHWPRDLSGATRREVAAELRDYRRCNTHRAVRRAYSAGDALYGYM